MKKIINALLAICVIAVLTSCSNGNSFTIYGEMDNGDFDGCPIILVTLDNAQVIDSTIIENGKFQFSEKLEKTMMGFLFAKNAETGMTAQSALVLEKGKIHINICNDSLYGTPLNDLLYKSYTADSLMRDCNLQRMALMNQYMAASTDSERQAIELRFGQIDSLDILHRRSISRSLFRNNMDNVLGAYALSLIVEADGISYDSLDYFMTHSGPIFSDYEPLREARTRLFHVESTSVGKKYVDLEGIDMATGKPSRLSAMIKEDKITIIDFWASWCSPCRQEISENLIRLYNKYHTKGVNIIGIDVWDKMEDHASTVEKLGIKYPQLIDTTRNATELYGVDAVPSILLIGTDGIIRYRDLRGEDIEQAIINELKIKN